MAATELAEKEFSRARHASGIHMMNGGRPFAMFLPGEYPWERKPSWIARISPRTGALLCCFILQDLLLFVLDGYSCPFTAFFEYPESLSLVFFHCKVLLTRFVLTSNNRDTSSFKSAATILI